MFEWFRSLFKSKVVVEPTKPKHNCIENGCIDGRYTGCYNNGGYLEITVTCTVCGKVLRKSRKPPKTH